MWIKAAFVAFLTLPLSCAIQQERGSVVYGQTQNLAQVGGKLQQVSNLKETTALVYIDSLWNRHWENPNLSEKVIYWSTFRADDSRKWKLDKPVDLQEMAGFEFSPILTYMSHTEPWRGLGFQQHFLSLDGLETKKTWKEANSTYYFLPENYKRSTNNLPGFPSTFPSYSLPKGKTSVFNFSLHDYDPNKILEQGHSYLFSYGLPEANRSFYDYDDWLYAVGCPRAYSTDNEGIIRWLDGVDADALLESFKKNFYERYKNFGYVVMNWEAIAWARAPSFWKLQRCFDYWYAQKPKALLGIWGHGAFTINRLQFEGDNFKYYFQKALQTKPDANVYRKGITVENPMALDDFYANNADILFVGGYINYPTNAGYIHHYLTQYLISKKYYPNKKVLLSWWHNFEYVGDFNLSPIYFKNANGELNYMEAKPMVFPEAMHNAAVWSHAVGDGADLWSEPYARMNDVRYLGNDTYVYDLKGNRVPTSFYPNSSSQHAIENYSNLDRWQGGKWAISVNKDIMESTTTWQWNLLPSDAYYDKKPLIAYKLSEDAKEALVLVYDAWNNPLKQKIIPIVVEGKSFEVKIFGRYTSVIRLKLTL